MHEYENIAIIDCVQNIPIFEFIDDLRNRSIKEVISGNHEQTEEHIEKQDKVCVN